MSISKYTIIENPVEIRKNLLMTSKALIQILMIYEKLKVIRRERLEKMNQLKSVIEEINELMDKLLERLPEIKEFSNMKSEQGNNKEDLKKTKEAKSKSKERGSGKHGRKTKIDKLYDQLKQIDEVLKNLSS